ncbi:MAG: Dipeptidyl-peptidase 5 [Chloroflexi bacterium]|nr:Dipeptidyl-peptidase 5 [Chloroflexota bacterium]
MSNPEKRPLTAEDLYRFQTVTAPEISPDGQHVVFCVQRVDEENEKKYTNLWIAPTAGGEARQFTFGDHVDASPKWSPDGRRIAFLSNRENEKQPQIFTIPFQGGEARQLTDMKGEFGSLAWSPDGTKFVSQFRKKDEEALEREKDEGKKELGVVSRDVTRVFYKLDGHGFLPQERWHVWVLDAETGEGEQLTEGEVFDELQPAWSPDGARIAFHSNRAEDPDLDPDAIDLFTIPAAGGEEQKIEAPFGPKQHPVFSPDGKRIAYLGYEGRGQWWKNTCLWVTPVDGSERAKNLTKQFDFTIGNITINDFPGHLPMSPPAWSEDGQRIFFQVAHHGNTVLKSISINGDEESLETIVGGEGTTGGFTFSADQARIAYLFATMTELAEVFVYDVGAERAQALTHINEEVFDEIDLGTVEEVWFEGADNNNLQGWIIKPPNFDESKQYPSILEIHGGPRAQYGNLFMHEFYYLAAQGYVVYFTNPRGGRGYGEEHSKAIWNQWGTVDYEDLMAWTDFMEEKAYIDSERMGVTGGSYGGYMTVWIIGHTDRFKAAVTQRCVSNLLSMYGSSDMNWVFQQEFGDKPPWENFENFWRQSPIRYIGEATTPTQVIHSENDLRCPIEQGEQVFVSLKKLGVDTEMIRFPDEPHGLSRGGRTDRRIVRLEHMARWFDTYLK